MFSTIRILDTIIDTVKAINNRDIAVLNNQTKALALYALIAPEEYAEATEKLVALLKSENANQQEETLNG